MRLQLMQKQDVRGFRNQLIISQFVTDVTKNPKKEMLEESLLFGFIMFENKKQRICQKASNPGI